MKSVRGALIGLAAVVLSLTAGCAGIQTRKNNESLPNQKEIQINSYQATLQTPYDTKKPGSIPILYF